MWVLTQSGFLQRRRLRPTPNGPGAAHAERRRSKRLLLVRARVRSDLAAMLDAIELPGSRAVSTPAADYPFRAVVTREEWARFLSHETEHIHYPNFKSRVAEVQGRRGTTYTSGCGRPSSGSAGWKTGIARPADRDRRAEAAGT